MLKYIILILISLFFCFKCTTADYVIENSVNPDDYLTVWAHSDIQPRNENEKENYEIAAADINKNFPRIDVAVFCGDIVQHSDFNDIFLWYKSVKHKVSIPEWYEIAGNHDWRAINLYRNYIRKELNYTAQKGNILFIMMSNENNSRQSFISDATFNWWKSLVITNQDKIIITVTHGNLKGSGLISAKFDRLNIIDSSRFIEVLKSYKVDIWISGHSHFPGWLANTHYINSDLQGICFIDTGAIRKDSINSVESRLLYFKPGSNIALLYYRDHLNQRRLTCVDYKLILSHPYIPQNLINTDGDNSAKK